MDLNFIANAIKMQAEGNTMFHQAQVLNAAVDDVPKHKQKALGTFVWLVPCQLALPFNPFNPTEDLTFNKDNRFYTPCTPTTFMLSIKQYIRELYEDEDENERKRAVVLHNFYAAHAGKKKDSFSIDPVYKEDVQVPEKPIEILSEDDLKIINQFKMPMQLTLNTQKISTKETGQYGVEFLSPIKLDENGSISKESEDLIATQLFNFETDVMANKVAKYNLENPPETLDSDKKEALKTLRKSRKITFPRKSGVTLILEVPCVDDEASGDVIPDKAQLEKKKEFIESFVWSNLAADALAKLKRKCGKRADINPDYLMVKITYEDATGDSNQPKDLAIALSRGYHDIAGGDPLDVRALFGKATHKVGDKYTYVEDGEKLTAKYTAEEIAAEAAEDFNPKFRVFLDEMLGGGFEKIARNKIGKYRPKADNTLLAYYPSRVKELIPFISENIYMKYVELFEKISPEISETLSALSSAGKLATNWVEALTTQSAETGDIKLAENLQKDLAALGDEDRKEAVAKQTVEEEIAEVTLEEGNDAANALNNLAGHNDEELGEIAVIEE